MTPFKAVSFNSLVRKTTRNFQTPTSLVKGTLVSTYTHLLSSQQRHQNYVGGQAGLQ